MPSSTHVTPRVPLSQAIQWLKEAAERPGRNLHMPMIPRYEKAELAVCLGYDQWAGWCILVEWYWLETLAQLGEMPLEDQKHLQPELLRGLLEGITTTMQDRKEKDTKHDIQALIALMQERLPEELHKWLHLCATSYDIIDTAYALQLRVTFEEVLLPKIGAVDELWRRACLDYANVVQAGRTHLQTANPVTVGFWLGTLHTRFADTAREATGRAQMVPGKFSGPVGTGAAHKLILQSEEAEVTALALLGLPDPVITTQITPPEGRARFYHELVLMSAVLANLGGDSRILQSSQFGELGSLSSGSSAMSHKTANPILAENLGGMVTIMEGEYFKLAQNLTSDLQRDLRGSCVMRGYPAMQGYLYSMLSTAEKFFKSLTINEERCFVNFQVDSRLVVAEALHLTLQREGFRDAHKFVNKVVIPLAVGNRELDLHEVLRLIGSEEACQALEILDRHPEVSECLDVPALYVGSAIDIAIEEASNRI